MFETCVRCSLAVATAFVALVGCALPDEADDAAAYEVIGVPGTALEPRGVYVRGPEAAAPEHITPRALAAPKHRVIYMNRSGGTFTPGASNSMTNRSSIVSYIRLIGA